MPGSVASLALAAAVLAPLLQGGALHPHWRVVTLPQQTMPATAYSAESVDGREAVRVQARASYGNLVHDMRPRDGADAPQPPRQLRWAWRVQQPNPGVDLGSKAGDDAAIKVCMSFDLPLARVPFLERQLLLFARTRSAEPLPAATLCWVWANREPKGALLPNAYTRRVRYIVLRNAQDALATWHEESRDVAADFRRAFGDESPELPPLSAVIVAADADNTGAASLAHISALRIEP